ncbi:MAG: NDP-sugar synthase [Candidatus Rokubacteria bacterium]|nr:NDP-sugar synthase [Candidatus Rokubacteria bacterium]
MPQGLPDPRRHPRHAHQRGGALDPGRVTAVILAGGEGTRLRPLTLKRPKPIVPLLNIPFLAYQLVLLRDHGVRDVVLSCSYLVDEVERALGDGAAWGVRLRYAVETVALGTAGGVRNAADLVGDLVVVLNGDVLTDVDLSAMLRFHAERQAAATIYLTRVPDPSAYGLVELEAGGRVLRFIEKPDPAHISTDTVNAGVYLLDRALLVRIPPDRAVSIEREFFPGLLADRLPFFAWVGEHYWLDIGNPAKYRQGQLDLLAARVATPLRPAGTGAGGRFLGPDVAVEDGAVLEPPVVLGRGTRLAAGARVGGSAVLGAECRVGRRARVTGAILWEDVVVGEGAALRDCLVGNGARIGDGAALGPGTVLAAGAVVPPGARLGA